MIGRTRNASTIAADAESAAPNKRALTAFAEARGA